MVLREAGWNESNFERWLKGDVKKGGIAGSLVGGEG
jgi:hypothetical protein